MTDFSKILDQAKEVVGLKPPQVVPDAATTTKSSVWTAMGVTKDQKLNRGKK